MAWNTKVALPMPLLGAAAFVTLSALGGIVYNLQQVRDLQAELLDMKMTLERVKARPAEVETPKVASTPAVTHDDLDALRGELAQVRGELQRPPGGKTDALAAVAAPASNVAGTPAVPAAEATPADEKIRRILASLESQDQALLKDVVGEVLEQRQAEEREAKRKRQAQEYVKDLTKTLALTQTQQQQIGAIVEQRSKMIEDLRAQANDQNRQEVRKKIEAARKDGEKQILPLLTAEQSTKFQDWSAKHPEGRGDGPPGKK